MITENRSAFTLIELLVVIAIIATIAAFAVPALTSALTKGQMTGTMNSARQLYLAGYQMSLDGTTNADANLAWPGDYSSGVTTLQAYVEKLVQNDYLKASDLAKILSAPGASCTATASSATPPAVTLSGTSGLKVYPVTSADASNVIFVVTSNYKYNTALATTDKPYGDKGFVVVRKGGDAAVLRKSNAVAATGATGAAAFESTVGKKPGDAQGTVGSGDPSPVLTYP
jgi:prepilin-type N-terminal cleavage/methylation domain-containing protein